MTVMWNPRSRRLRSSHECCDFFHPPTAIVNGNWLWTGFFSPVIFMIVKSIRTQEIVFYINELATEAGIMCGCAAYVCMYVLARQVSLAPADGATTAAAADDSMMMMAPPCWPDSIIGDSTGWCY